VLRTSNKQTYMTGFITSGNERWKLKPPFNGAGWQADLIPREEITQQIQPRYGIVIHARNWIAAQKALILIHGSHQLLQASPDVLPIKPIAHNDNEPEFLDADVRERIARQEYCAPGFPHACALAARASRKRVWCYSVLKYKLSLSIYSVLPIETHPDHFPFHMPVSRFPSDHIMFSYAITSAFSVIEELGFSVNASSSKPSVVKGAWNPIVKQDLEDRLRGGRIDLAEGFLWIVRGSKRRIESKRPLPSGKRPSWATNATRDVIIPLIDAIAYASWLRSKVSAHTVKDTTVSLSPYDVVNVQDLARRLLLETTGFWRYWGK